MHEGIILSAIIRTVPQWYASNQCAHEYLLRFADSTAKLCSHRPITASLTALLDYAQSRLPVWQAQMPKIPTPSAIAKIGEDLAMRWLEVQDLSVDWNKWIAYAEELRLKTHENERIERNLIISSAVGSQDITDAAIQNVLDSLTAHPQVFIRVDKHLRFIDYDEILWSEIKDSAEYKFSPEFLQPLLSVMHEDEYCAHLSSHGDILIAGNLGMLASCRKGQWFVYDVEALRDAIVEIIGDYHVGCHLFEVLFDLSYRRHGALLVFDPDRQVVRHVANKESIIADGGAFASADPVRRMLTPRIRSIHMAAPSHKDRKKRLFLEVAEVDGALIFDTRQVLAFGAMIEFHPDSGRYFGARAAAAQSALLWGGYAFKVSADGDITVLFTDKATGDRAELRFM